MMRLSQGRERPADIQVRAGKCDCARIAALLTLGASLVLATMPSAAQAASGAEGPLLSGYGGPGTGEQAILGSKVLPSRHRGGGEAGGPSEGSAATTGAARSGAGGGVQTGTAETAGGRAGTGGGTPSTAGQGARANESGGEASGTGTSHRASAGAGASGSGPTQASVPRAGTETAVVAAAPLGLSGGDLAAVIAVACALVAIAALTRFAAKGDR